MIAPESARWTLIAGTVTGIILYELWAANDRRRHRLNDENEEPSRHSQPDHGEKPAAQEKSTSTPAPQKPPPLPPSPPSGQPRKVDPLPPPETERIPGSDVPLADEMPNYIQKMSGDELWAEARRLPHNAIPSRRFDAKYLELLYRAASVGHIEAMKKIGDYALRRYSFVEAYYWYLMAEEAGARDVFRTMNDIQQQWMMVGCPHESENEYADFSAEQGSYARAMLNFRSGINVSQAKRYIDAVRRSRKQMADPSAN